MRQLSLVNVHRLSRALYVLKNVQMTQTAMATWSAVPLLAVHTPANSQVIIYLNWKECALSLEMQIGVDTLTLTLFPTVDLLNPKSITVSMTILLCQVSNHCDQGFLIFRAIIPAHPHTHIYHKVIAAHTTSSPRITNAHSQTCN